MFPRVHQSFNELQLQGSRDTEAGEKNIPGSPQITCDLSSLSSAFPNAILSAHFDTSNTLELCPLPVVHVCSLPCHPCPYRPCLRKTSRPFHGDARCLQGLRSFRHGQSPGRIQCVGRRLSQPGQWQVTSGVARSSWTRHHCANE